MVSVDNSRVRKFSFCTYRFKQDGEKNGIRDICIFVLQQRVTCAAGTVCGLCGQTRASLSPQPHLTKIYKRWWWWWSVCYCIDSVVVVRQMKKIIILWVDHFQHMLNENIPSQNLYNGCYMHIIVYICTYGSMVYQKQPASSCCLTRTFLELSVYAMFIIICICV